MKRNLSLMFSLVLACLVQMPTAHAAKFSLNWYKWLNYPWEMRYVIVVNTDFETHLDLANTKDKKAEERNSPEFRKFEPHFDTVFPFSKEAFAQKELGLYEFDHSRYGKLGFQVIAFDRSGQVLNPHRYPQALSAKQVLDGDRVRTVMLVAGDGKPGDPWQMLGTWFEGFPSGDGGDFSPALCHWHWDDGRYTLNSSERYFHPNRKFNRREVEERIGLFGCREWTYQLYRRPAAMGLQEFPAGRPYIDVTSYGGKRGEKTKIGQFLGWARFDDPPRPVIGKHGKYWVCLHECPDGEAPGLIPDIVAWTKKRGWPLPKPMPTFPDSRFKKPYVAENPD